MALFSLSSTQTVRLMNYTYFVLLFFVIWNYQHPIHPIEQKALYNVLNSINPHFPWRTLFPGDLCRIPPPGVVCHYAHFFSFSYHQPKSHIVQLNFAGYISGETPTLPCSSNATLNPLLFTSFTHLTKLSFHKCFNNTQNLINLPSFPPSLQELVFIDNPSIVSSLQPFLLNLTSLKRLVLVGNEFNGKLPSHIGGFQNLEELTLSRNNLSGEIPVSLGMLKKLKILDLSYNYFKGCVPEQVGNLASLLKLDLSYNEFSCKIPESFKRLKKLEFLDLSFNLFGDFGAPLFLREIPKLKEQRLSENSLSEIWGNYGVFIKIGWIIF